MIRVFFFAVFLFVNFVLVQAQQISIIPNPQVLHPGDGYFWVKSSTKIIAPKEVHNVADLFSDILIKSTGYKLKTETPKTTSIQKGNINLVIDADLKLSNNEAYLLDVTKDYILLKAKSSLGLFYGLQSVRQLLPASIESQTKVKNAEWKVPVLHIEDYPRFEWRGFMLDVSRTFYNTDVIKKYLDLMALYKLNTFHWHLTDDQGWRVEIKSHPELTSHKTTVFGGYDAQPAYRSGYYTQNEIKEIIKYASDRNITIVPEIDVPGHCWPIIITHPELGTNQKFHPDFVMTFQDSYAYWGFQFTPNPLDPTNDKVYALLSDVFGEICDLFPGKYIHFGGDEVVHRLWENEPKIKDFMKVHNMNRVEELQSYFVSRISAVISKKGKVPIGWNDILGSENDDKTPLSLPKTTAIMSWIGSSAVKKAAKFGFHLVATPTGPLYFDITQNEVNDGTLADWNYSGFSTNKGVGNTLKRVYSYDPLNGLSEEEQKFVLGIQANMWTALPQEVKDLNVMVFPRAIALSEICWSLPQRKNFDDFQTRLKPHYARLDALKVDYFTDGGFIIDHWKPKDVSTTYQTKEWDVTQKVYSNGRIQVGFFYTSGKSFLNVKNVKLLENGKVVAEDLHESLADNERGTPYLNKKRKTFFFYFLPLNKYNPQAKYSIQAEIAGQTSEDSEGNITFSLSPEKPFEVTAQSKK